jgi:hypothetical protein
MSSREQEQAEEAEAMAGEDGEPRTMEFVGSERALGIEGLFNTFRMGKKWSDASILEELQLVVEETTPGRGGQPRRAKRAVDGHAVVLAVDQGGLADMLDKHCGLNHGVRHVAHASDQRLALRRILENAYGRRLADGEHCVVVYIARMVG